MAEIRAESHLTPVCALLLCQDPVQAEGTVWRVGAQFRAVCWVQWSGVLFSETESLTKASRLTFSLLGGLLPLEVSQIHTATPIVIAADLGGSGVHLE